MYLFFYGQNDYLIHKQMDQLKERYKQKNSGDLNLLTINGDEMTPELFLAEVLAVPLLATSRLIIVRNIFKNKAKTVLDKVKDSLSKIPPSTVVIFTEFGQPDKRLGLFKVLNKPKISKEFKELSGSDLVKFIEKEAASRGLKIAPDVVHYLIDAVGPELFQLEGELEKLALYCDSKEATRADVDLLVSKNYISDAFKLVEDLVKGRRADALSELEKLLENGEPPLKILGLINYQFRTLAQVMEGVETSPNQYAIAKSAGLAPFQVAKVLPVAKNTSWPKISAIYQKLAAIDEAIKTGIIEGGEGLKALILEI